MLIRLLKAPLVRVIAGLLVANGLVAATDGMIRVRQVMQPPDNSATDAAILRAGVEKVNFRLALRYRCTAPLEPRRVFVAVADTFAVHPVSSADGAGRDIDLAVPADQLVGLDVTKHCEAAIDPDREGLIRVSNVFAATASLVCGAEEHHEGYVTGSAALDLWVECPADYPPVDAE